MARRWPTTRSRCGATSPSRRRGAPYWEELRGRARPDALGPRRAAAGQDREDGSLAVRCSCRAAICGSCGVKINGQSTLACKTQIGEAQPSEPAQTAAPTAAPGRADHGRADGQHAGDQGPGHRHGVDPLDEDPPRHPVAARRRRRRPSASTSSPPESMVDVTQSIACIQCGACVSSCLSMEADPDFIGPAALAKAYRFVGDPRDGADRRAPLRPRPGPARDLRLHPLLLLHRRLPEGRRADGPDHAPAPRAPATTTRSTTSTTAAATRRPSSKIIEKKGTLDESLLLQESFAPGVKGKLMPTPARDQGPARLDPDRDPRHPHRQDALALEADPRRPPQAARRRAGARQADLRARRGAPRSSSTSTSRARSGEEDAEPSPRTSRPTRADRERRRSRSDR